MKKLLVLMLALVMALSLAACGASKPASVSALPASSQQTSSQPSQETGFTAEQQALAKEFSEMVDAYNATVDKVNESPELLSDEELVNTMNALTDGITELDGYFTSPEILTPEVVESFKFAIEQIRQFIDVAEAALNEIDNAKAASATDAVIVPVEIFNLTGIDVVALALSPANDNEWGENLITGVIKDGEKVQGELPFTEDTLVWDILLQDSQGTQLTFMGVDFSDASTDGAKLVLETTESGKCLASVN